MGKYAYAHPCMMTSCYCSCFCLFCFCLCREINCILFCYCVFVAAGAQAIAMHPSHCSHASLQHFLSFSLCIFACRRIALYTYIYTHIYIHIQIIRTPAHAQIYIRMHICPSCVQMLTCTDLQVKWGEQVGYSFSRTAQTHIEYNLVLCRR